MSEAELEELERKETEVGENAHLRVYLYLSLTFLFDF